MLKNQFESLEKGFRVNWCLQIISIGTHINSWLVESKKQNFGCYWKLKYVSTMIDSLIDSLIPVTTAHRGPML
jgi:hypothetical protein